jgi:glycine betaine/choline ABC-type transport system substrate-binding protein
VSPRRLLLAVLTVVALTGGVLVAMSTGAASVGRSETVAGPTTTTSAATVPEPVVTTVTQPTVPPQRLPGTNRPTVVLGDMNTAEQFIVGQLYETALEAEGYTITLTRNIGQPSLRTWALKHGTLSIYPEYLGEWNSSIAHLHRRFRTLEASYAAARSYAHRHGFVLLPPTPFSDTSCVAVLAQYAAANHIRSIPQLARSGPIVFGAPNVFQSSSDGVPALQQSYHLDPDYVQPIGDGLQYWWLGTGNVQAAYCSTTDPALSGPRYVQLSDPKRVFGHGNIVPVTTRQVLRVEGRAFARTLMKVDSLLTQRAIRGLNAELELGGHTPDQIARQFLEGNGLLPRSRYAPVPTTTSQTAPGN